MLIYKKDLDPTKGEHVWCFAQYNPQSCHWKTPKLIQWSFYFEETEEEIQALLNKIPLITTTILKHRQDASYTYETIFGGHYPTWANLIIEAGLIRTLVNGQNEGRDAQIIIRNAILNNATHIKDFKEKYKRGYDRLINCGHSPLYGIETETSPVSLKDYIKASIITTNDDSIKKNSACIATHDNALSLYC